jgi:hypothetical protein
VGVGPQLSAADGDGADLDLIKDLYEQCEHHHAELQVLRSRGYSGVLEGTPGVLEGCSKGGALLGVLQEYSRGFTA